MATVTPAQFAEILKSMPKDIAARAAAQATAAGGAAAEAVEIFEGATTAELTFAESVLLKAKTLWHGRVLSAIFFMAGVFGLEKIVEKVLSVGVSSGFAYMAGLWPSVTGEMAYSAYQKLDSFSPIGVSLTGKIYAHIFGGVINADALASAYTIAPKPAGSPGSEGDSFGSMGAAAASVFDSMFDVGGVVGDYARRVNDDHSFANFRRVMGANLSIQIRAQVMAIAAQMFPLGPFKHLPELHRSLISSMGLNRLAHTMLGVYSHHLIHQGIQRSLLRQIKPSDLTEHEALKAYLEGRIDRTTLSEVLDNRGVRNDIRDLLIAMAEPDLTEAEAQVLYEEGVWHPSDIETYFHEKGFQPLRRALKAQTIELDREWKLKKHILAQNAKLFRDCVIPEGALRAQLAANNYSVHESDLFIQAAILERAQRRFLSLAQMKAALALKDLTNSDVLADLRCQGYTERDAGIVLEEMLGGKTKVPKITQFSVTPGVVLPGGAVVIQWTTTLADTVHLHVEVAGQAPYDQTLAASGTQNMVIQQDTTFRLSASNKAGEVSRADAVQIRHPRPTASLSVSPGRITIGILPTEVEVKWSTNNATRVTISPTLGPVAADGAQIVRLNADTTFTLTAEGPGGVETVQDTVIAQLPSVALPHVVTGPPKVKLTVSPATASAGQDVAIQWEIEDADEAHLYPGGEKISGTGAKIVKITAETIFVIEAKNSFGTTRKTDVVTFK